ncbi:hypothetical protein CKM354_000986200 [Cercospora kikuchii]|uniref:AB hydrolase-1 domain-containing protein n=1 Tax=Cercospora kikuchii TaxID=84275 RepID=A0A9P3CLM6_9PEZI|nr:uncharacterized protein CKM354_000986200 [Cercospora kikuchii]GIZ46749.1 hypothetical protein CKM354_000986200 [Cercospora kikuchii]
MADQTLKTLHPFLQENTSQVSSGGHVKSYSHDLGSGPIFVCVHGWPQSSYMWRHVVSELKDTISLFVPELPGYGFSSLPPKHDKRTVGNLIIEALQQVFSKDRPVIWCGHDRGGRIGHRLIVDNTPSHNIISAILIDIVPTKEQWAAFSNPAASAAYYHWPFLALPTAPQMISAMGSGEFTKINLERAKGASEAGVSKFKENDAVGHYCHQFSNPECVAGSCGDYHAGAFEDVEEQTKDQESGRKVTIPLMVVWSASNLGRMHDVPKVWKGWVERPEEVRFEPVDGGFGHYLPEECPERVLPLFREWIEGSGK